MAKEDKSKTESSPSPKPKSTQGNPEEAKPEQEQPAQAEQTETPELESKQEDSASSAKKVSSKAKPTQKAKSTKPRRSKSVKQIQPKDSDEDEDDEDKNDKVLLIDSEGTVITLSQLPETIPIFPMFQRPIFPGILTMVGSGKPLSDWIKEELEKSENIMGLLMVNPDKFAGNQELAQIQSPEEFFGVGTVSYVLHWVELPDKSCQFMLSALQRFRVKKMVLEENRFFAEVEYLDEPEFEMTEDIKGTAAAIVSSIKELIPHNPIYSQEMNYLLSQVDINDPATLTDLAASVTNAKGDTLQNLLETMDLQERMEKTLLLLREEYDLSLLKEKISQKIEDRISQHQREFFLREQLKQIKLELGIEQDRKHMELQEFNKKFAKLKLSEEAQSRVQQELRRFEMLDEQSPEIHVIHQYLDWMSSLPWGVNSKDRLSLERAERILNKDHYGLNDVKKRILEFIGVSKIKGSVKGAILCLVGPPGVGKTSLGKSIARALGRKFYRFSVGGLSDESEIKGHRRTYVGALPGKLIHALRNVKTANPVILLDEIDKIGSSYRGDPASMLLEVLDPEQNTEFLDHYLDVRFDLSNVLFVATANVLDTIPPPLLDRMEIMRLSGYVPEEKYNIAQKYLLPKVLEQNGLTKEQLRFSRDALTNLCVDYSREAGVRGLEKKLNRIARSIATQMARKQDIPKEIQPGLLEKYLGLPDFKDDRFLQTETIGVVRGLAWTPHGGTLLYIEATPFESKGGSLKLTGQLGGVMQESSQIAHSFVQKLLKHVGDGNKFLKKSAVHLHVPAGAIPKDGPSAGIAIATALLSLAINEASSADLAMTGEITLTGYVLPVGGIREKLVGARQAEIKHVVLPKDNERDVLELPAYITQGLEINYVRHFHEVAEIALGMEFDA